MASASVRSPPAADLLEIAGCQAPGVRSTLQRLGESPPGRVKERAATDTMPIEEESEEPKGASAARSFWRFVSVEDLAKAQDVGPMHNVEALFHTWPGEDGDGFEEAVNELRRAAREAARGR